MNKNGNRKNFSLWVVTRIWLKCLSTKDKINLCSHLQKKLFEPEGVHYPIWQGSAEDAILMWAMRMLWNRSTIQTRSM